jgi:Na+-transporting methylmalonyl-CoA/oxaloacetate decarboxylase gamma subunit/DNA-binding beta-propeller fold protein YncE
MNKNKLYLGLIVILVSALFSKAYAIEEANAVKADSVIMIEKTITQNLIKQGQNGIQTQNVVYDEKNKVFYVININNNSLDIIDYSDIDSLRFISKIDLSAYGKKPVAVAFADKKIAVATQNENAVDSGKVVFFSANGDFINSFSVAPSVSGISFDEAVKKVYVSNFYKLGYKINVIDYANGIENLTNANFKTLTYEKEKAADAFIILDPSGIGMTMIAMSVVFVALIFLYLVFRFIGKLNTAHSKKKALLKQGKVEEASKISEDAPGDVYAAIAMALHIYQTQLHDEENTVITMEKVARSYSPWSSKIYGLRQYHKN